MNLSGKYALVTGGSRGIGLEICRTLVDNCVKVLAISRSPSQLAIAQKEIPELLTCVADVSVIADINRLTTQMEQQWGVLDILVNNAGVAPRDGKDLAGDSIEAFQVTLKVNLLGAFLCTNLTLPLLLKSVDPRIINVSSTLGTMSSKLISSYDISKAGLNALTIAFSNQLYGRVAVNAISPGWVRTDMAPEAPGDPRNSAEIVLDLLKRPRNFTGRFVGREGEIQWSCF